MSSAGRKVCQANARLHHLQTFQLWTEKSSYIIRECEMWISGAALGASLACISDKYTNRRLSEAFLGDRFTDL